ncbi:MAG: hypothetical protein LH485_00095 [Sphingomonas bacterium]|nr:hypothetical protein [Sphingomonas bacterium]
MTQRNFTLPALLALALAACQQPANDTDIAIDNEINAAEAANAEVETLPPSEEGGAPVATNEATPAALPTQIPAQFHGRWGLNRADCTSTRGDAKGLLTINDAQLTFYESRGTLGKVLGASTNSFDANYGFTGEGQTWQRVERLKMVNDKLQRRTDAAAAQEPAVNLTYSRCGA